MIIMNVSHLPHLVETVTHFLLFQLRIPASHFSSLKFVPVIILCSFCLALPFSFKVVRLFPGALTLLNILAVELSLVPSMKMFSTKSFGRRTLRW